ncbi:MAG TPA: STAS domain-containing protein [Burkholderiales bacterium]|jgi:phospholipid transport system transporter-binding protein
MIVCNADLCTVQGPVTAENVVSLLAQGAQQFTAPRVTVDLSGVTEVDSSALSLLLEWRREAARNGREVRYRNLPASMKSLAELYGVTELLGQP